MKLLLSALVLFGAVAANAQVTSRHSHTYTTSAMNDNQMEVQFKVGPGFNTVSNGDQLNAAAGGRTAITLAADINLPVTGNFSVLTGLEYIQKGLTANTNASNVTFSVNYLEVPVLAQYNLGISRSSKLTFGLGPYFALAVSRNQSTDATNGNNGDTTNSNVDLSNQTNGFDFGARAAVAFETVLTHDLNFVGGLSYDLGFLNVGSNTNNVQNFPSFDNRSFIADVGVALKI